MDIVFNLVHLVNQRFSIWGTRTPGGTPEFSRVREVLAETKATCHGAKMLLLCVIHEGEIVFLD